MAPEQLELTKTVGFEFGVGQQMRLKDYEGKWGTSNVKQIHNASLYIWIQHQKAKQQGAKLKKE